MQFENIYTYIYSGSLLQRWEFINEVLRNKERKHAFDQEKTKIQEKRKQTRSRPRKKERNKISIKKKRKKTRSRPRKRTRKRAKKKESKEDFDQERKNKF